MRIKYSSNNSGGSWWLSTKDWQKLQEAGWHCYRSDYGSDGKYHDISLDDSIASGKGWLKAHATYAEKDFPGSEKVAMATAVAEWEEITNQNAEDEGCHCCGQPHSFYVVTPD